MDRLWTPWRYNYLSGGQTAFRPGVPAQLDAWPGPDSGCVFCNLIASVDFAVSAGMAAEQAEQAAHIVLRGPHCFTCLNAFPYASGHVLTVPYEHTASLAELPREPAGELIETAQRIETALRAVYRPDGINLGMNLGKAAGAGVAEHLHLHTLPRWLGDVNFMTAIAETRILPETLDITWARLRTALQPDRSALTAPSVPASTRNS